MGQMPPGRAAVTSLAAAVSVAALAAGARPPTLDATPARAGRYVGQFIERFSNVVAEERYVQDTLGNLQAFALGGRGTTPRLPTRSAHRELKSDFLRVKIGPLDWLPFRDVFEVDGKPIRDR